MRAFTRRIAELETALKGDWREFEDACGDRPTPAVVRCLHIGEQVRFGARFPDWRREMREEFDFDLAPTAPDVFQRLVRTAIYRYDSLPADVQARLETMSHDEIAALEKAQGW